MLVHGGAEGLPLDLEVADRGRLAAPLKDQVLVLASGVADRDWLRRAQRLDLKGRVAAAQFGVRGDGQIPGTGGGLFPFPPVGHGLGKGLSLLLILIAQGPVASGQVLVPCGAILVVCLADGVGSGGGADGAQAGVESAEPGQA